MRHWLMGRHLTQPFVLWLKTEHFSKQSERLHVFTRLKLGDGLLNIHKGLVKVVRPKASLHATIITWHYLFCSEDKHKRTVTPPRPPKTTWNKEKSLCSRRSLKADPHICIWEISSKLAPWQPLHEKARCKVNTAQTDRRSESMPFEST